MKFITTVLLFTGIALAAPPNPALDRSPLVRHLFPSTPCHPIMMDTQQLTSSTGSQILQQQRV